MSISRNTKVIPITAPLDRAWGEYVAAEKKARGSLDMQDGIEAGRAWRRWLDLFMSEDQRAAIGGRR